MQTPDGDPVLVFGRAGWGRIAVITTDLAKLVPEAASRLAAAAVARTTAGEPASKASIQVAGAAIEIELPSRSGLPLPRVTAQLPSGRVVETRLTLVRPQWLHGSIPAEEAGEYLVDVDGRRTRLYVAVPPERRAAATDPQWAERLARAGGGVADGFLPSIPKGTRPTDLAPWLLALAALIFLADAGWRIAAGERAFRAGD